MQDDALLELCEDDGMTVEPRHYTPVIPLLLVNGTHGIGTGWSTSIPMHDPLEVRLFASRFGSV
jgi:DNA topoisomerase-2